MNDEPTPEEIDDKRIQQADHLDRLTRRIYWVTAIVLLGFVIVQVILYFRK